MLQVWQALTEAVSRQPANSEVTLVFTDLVGFSTWSLEAGDDAALTLLRQVARAVEPPLLDAGGHIVKRLGDGIMAVFRNPTVAVGAVLAARDGAEERRGGRVYAANAGRYPHWPAAAAGRRLAGRRRQHRGPGNGTRHQRRRHGVEFDTGPDTQSELDALGVVAKRARKPVFASKLTGIPADLAIYRLRTRREFLPHVETAETNAAGIVEGND